MKRSIWASIGICCGTFATADTFPVTENAVFTFQGEEVVISRSALLDDPRLSALSAPAADCPAPCLAPMQAAPGVPTLGELDVIAFLSSDVEAGDGLLIDARMPDERSLGFIPASVNIPAVTMSDANPYRGDILQALGAREYQGILSFEEARRLVIFDHGPSAMDASAMIATLIEAGYPADKLGYYRGGMQVWAALGLTIAGAAQ
ncbi:MAG: rhodanese-like domain-containing protein [Pseudomonadota bacterium]